MKKILFLGLMFVVSGCLSFPKYSNDEQMKDAALKRASYDLQCPEGNIAITTLSPSSPEGTYSGRMLYGAEGCGKRMSFEAVNQSDVPPLVYLEGAAPPVVDNQRTRNY